MSLTARAMIVGTQRSGSNLLRLALGSLPDVFAPPSTHTLEDFEPIVAAYGDLALADRRDWLVRDIVRAVEANVLAWPPSVLDAREIAMYVRQPTLRAVYIALYDAAALQVGARIWVTKDLENLWRTSELASECPGLKFVHLVRDPRDVVASFTRAPIGPKHPTIAAMRWRDDQRRAIIAHTAFLPQAWLQVRYEDVVADPEPEIQRVCEFLGCEFTEAALHFYRREDAQRAHSLSTLWTNLDRPIFSSSVGRFRISQPHEIETIERIVFKEMIAFGYRPEHVDAPSAPTQAELAEAKRIDAEFRVAVSESLPHETERLHARRSAILAEIRSQFSTD